VLNTISLDDVRMAVKRAEKIMNTNELRGYGKNNYSKYSWYSENPATEAGQVIGTILHDCNV